MTDVSIKDKREVMKDGAAIFDVLRRKYGDDDDHAKDMICNTLLCAMVLHIKMFSDQQQDQFIDVLIKALRHNLKTAVIEFE